MKTRSLSLCVLLAAAACDGTDVGNPAQDLDIDMAAYGLTVTGGDQPSVVDQAWVAVDRIRLRDAADCSGSSEIDLSGPFAIDLLAAGATDMLRDVAVSTRDYCRFELRWQAFDSLPDGAPALLDGASMLWAGTRGDGTPFVLRSRRDDELRLDAVDGAFAVTDVTSALIVGLDAEALFAGVDLAAAAVGGDDIIHIDDDTNSAALEVFEDNLDQAARLFEDGDGNGDLDADEREPGDELAD